MDRFVLAFMLSLGLAGCIEVVADEDRRSARRNERRWLPAEAQIPPGHLPPPGQCRIWFPNRPPGHQPPPGPCRELRWNVPPGAMLVRG